MLIKCISSGGYRDGGSEDGIEFVTPLSKIFEIIMHNLYIS